MNKTNTLRVIKALEQNNIPNVEFDMRNVATARECGTACCIAGYCHALMGIPLDEHSSKAGEWLGLTERQKDTLFFPNDRNGTGIWDGIEDPIRLQGPEGAKQAVVALRRALELWGTD